MRKVSANHLESTWKKTGSASIRYMCCYFSVIALNRYYFSSSHLRHSPDVSILAAILAESGEQGVRWGASWRRTVRKWCEQNSLETQKCRVTQRITIHKSYGTSFIQTKHEHVQWIPDCLYIRLVVGWLTWLTLSDLDLYSHSKQRCWSHHSGVSKPTRWQYLHRPQYPTPPSPICHSPGRHSAGAGIASTEIYEEGLWYLKLSLRCFYRDLNNSCGFWHISHRWGWVLWDNFLLKQCPVALWTPFWMLVWPEDNDTYVAMVGNRSPKLSGP
jgi:hypothetical protein